MNFDWSLSRLSEQRTDLELRGDRIVYIPCEEQERRKRRRELADRPHEFTGGVMCAVCCLGQDAVIHDVGETGPWAPRGRSEQAAVE
jgi:hypothetical protein